MKNETALDPKRHATPLAFFLATNRREVKWLAAVSFCYCLAIASIFVATYYVGHVIDLLTSGSWGNIRSCLILIILGVAFREFFFRIGHVMEVRMDARLRATTKRVLFNKVTSLSYGYFADRFSGQLAHKISQVADAMERLTTIISNEFVNGTAVLLISSIVLGLVSPYLGGFIALWGIVFVIGILPYAKRLNDRANVYAEEESKASGVFVDFFTNIASVKVYGKQTSLGAAYHQIERERQAFLRLGLWSILAYNYVGIFTVILSAGMVGITLYLYAHTLITIGNIAFIAGVALNILSIAWDLGLGIISFIRERGEARQNLQDLIVAPVVLDGNITASAASDRIDIEYRHVTFGYDASRPILEGFSLSVPQMQKIGIVGLSGAGKTTFANLLLRFFDVQDGAILINGTDIRELSQDYLRSHISYISQDTSLFHTTIAENIAYGMPHATREQIEGAARTAYAAEFIETLPQSYESVVGERGIKLSGGQRQRIAIARAILANRPLFLLDEATSALDSDSEAKIQKGLEVLMEGKTVIAIAHRLSTLSRMDRIIFLEDGAIAEDGSHDELIRKNGKYAALWRMQAGGFLPDEL